MTMIEITLPDELAQRAKSAGLLSDAAIQELLESAMRRQAGQRLLDIADRLHAAGIAPISQEELDADIRAVRAERRDRGALKDATLTGRADRS